MSSTFVGVRVPAVELEPEVDVATAGEPEVGHAALDDVAARHRDRPLEPRAFEQLEVRVECLLASGGSPNGVPERPCSVLKYSFAIEPFGSRPTRCHASAQRRNPGS